MTSLNGMAPSGGTGMASPYTWRIIAAPRSNAESSVESDLSTLPSPVVLGL
jgi:hypothetical protein